MVFILPKVSQHVLINVGVKINLFDKNTTTRGAKLKIIVSRRRSRSRSARYPLSQLSTTSA